MAGSDKEQGQVKPSEQRGGITPDEDEARGKGSTTGSDEPTTEDGIDPAGGDNADATSDGGPDLPEGAEPRLKDAATAQSRADHPAG